MKDSSRTKKQLIEELTELRIKLLKLEEAGSGHGKTTGSLVESDDLYRLLISSIPCVTWISDVSGKTSFISRNVEKIYGFTAEEIQERGAELWFGRVHPDDKENLIKKWQAFFEEDIPFDIEYRIKRKDGEWIWLADKAVEKRDKEGRTVAYGIFTDITGRKRAEEALRNNETFLKIAQEVAHLGSWELDLLKNKLYWTDETYYIFEIDPGKFDATYEAFIDCMHPDDRALVAKVYADSLATRTGFYVEHRILMRDGSVKYVEERCQTYFADDGTPLRSIGTVLDITERKRIEEELRFNEERFRALSLAAFEGIVFAKTGKIFDCNEQFARIAGYGRDELIGTDGFKLIHPDDLACVRRSILSESEEAYAFRMLHKDGSVRDVEAHPRMMIVKGENLRVTAVNDITDRKKVEESLETLYKSSGWSIGKEFFDGVVESLYDWLGADCVIVGEKYGEDNIRALSMKIDGDKVEDFSYTLPDTPCAKVVCKDGVCFYPENVTGLFPFDEDLAQMGAVGYIGISLKGRDGALIGVLCALTKKKFVLPPNAEEVLKLVAARASAELERMRAEQEVVRLNESLELQVSERTAELRAVNKEQEAFAYSVSHDLRAPLRGIDGFSQALLEDYGDSLDANAKDYLNRIHSATQHMNELITDLLSLSKVTCSELRRESVDMTALVGKVIKHLEKIDPERSVETVVAGGVVVEKADSHMVRVIFDNLIGNAWKFTSKKDSARIEFGELDEDGERVFFIRDNGAGFNMAYAGKLFGAFQRLHSVKEFKGTGIGLATVQRIVGRHGGRVWAEAEPGVGATFYFTLS